VLVASCGRLLAPRLQHQLRLMLQLLLAL
jgi:hypothetical protein